NAVFLNGFQGLFPVEFEQANSNGFKALAVEFLVSVVSHFNLPMPCCAHIPENHGHDLALHRSEIHLATIHGCELQIEGLAHPVNISKLEFDLSTNVGGSLANVYPLEQSCG